GGVGMELNVILKKAFYQEASDVHLTVGQAPVFRVNGQLIKEDEQRLLPEDTEQMAKQILGENKWNSFLRERDIDVSYSVPGISRFRVNIYHQRNCISIAIRIIPTSIPSLTDLQMPNVLERFALKQKGLILVTGPTGSGKSTTLAAMIDYINQHKQQHIITLEDLIEYLHKHQQSLID